MYSRQPTSLVISRHYCYKKFILLNDDSLKNFRESYVFHCLVIKVLNSPSLRQLTYFITFTSACQVLFLSFFRGVLMFVCRSQATCLLYHMFVSYEPNRIRIFRCSCVKNFRESYVFHCLVIKVVCLCDSFAILSCCF